MTFPEEEEVKQEAAEAELRRVIHERGEKLVALLRRVQDAASARQHAAAIRELLLWEPTPEQMELVDEELLAVEFMAAFDRIGTELERLARVKFYGESSLQDLMLYFEEEHRESAE